jgi:hypothetical protein
MDPLGNDRITMRYHMARTDPVNPGTFTEYIAWG